MSARLAISPLSEAAGVIVSGVNVAEPLDEETRKAVYGLYLEHGLLLLRDQHLTPEQHIAFSRMFGGLDLHPLEQLRLDGYPEIMGSTMSGKVKDLERPDEVISRIPWHSDLTYTVRPSRGAVFYARKVPEEGGETGFIDTAAAYDRLNEDMKQRIAGLEVLHSVLKVAEGRIKTGRMDSKEETRSGRKPGARDGAEKLFNFPDFPDVIHPLVVTHPESGRKALNVSPLFTKRILGVPEEEGEQLLRELIAHATAPRHAYIHSWRVGDIIIWDNWRTMHMATGWKAKYVRDMHRTTISADYQMGRVAA